MGNLKTLLESRFKKNTQTKMEALARKRMEGELSPFTGRLSNPTLLPKEKEQLRHLLEHYNFREQIEEPDLIHLCTLSAEVKQIHHQSVLLHGERITKVRDLLKSYREGAFSSWLLLTYGNRQTPYNFLVYYELFTLLPEPLKIEMEKMPRQAVYTLASRQGSQEKKEEIIRNYRGERKSELLDRIRKEFPLVDTDCRKTSPVKQALAMLAKGSQILNKCTALSSDEQIILEKLIKKLEKVKSNLFPHTKV
ncbi:pGP6-D family virulence protein [Candidatus Chlamydia corallus]|uniref:pGP6-D family virulence protein n=1 Tax=Candidatus Chlamydia corallus TaxID=2038470 RepID=UPI000C2FBFB5|nr:pGP6-D family virulence protein [Candidatus Chlamydia corallus]